MDGFENCYQFEILNPDSYISTHAPLRGFQSCCINHTTHKQKQCANLEIFLGHLSCHHKVSQAGTITSNLISHNSGGAGKSKIKVSADRVFGMIPLPSRHMADGERELSGISLLYEP